MGKKIFFLSSLFLFVNYSFANITGFPENYYKMKATIKKQIHFFEYLYPHIENANKMILKEREFIISLNQNKNLDINSNSYKKLENIAKKYNVLDLYDYNKLLKKVDIVPPSMALAQAAVESGWGMSRFVKLGNNLFGHWTYGKVGIVPLKRDPNAKHLIRIFKSFEDSISSYMLNLNKTKAYYEFRNKRKITRDNNENPSGLKLSQTMINYSQIKKRYLKILKNVIIKNKLETYDKKFYTNLTKEKNEI